MSTPSPLAALYTVLQNVCANAAANAELLRKNEAATRAALIDPVLRALGWDTANVRMVEPEKTIGGDLRVDYLLYDAAGKANLVVEAKCLDASLDKHGYVSKVLGYALGFKVQTVFITDGLTWHCYSNLHRGNTEATTFTLAEQDLLSASLQLVQWLDAAHSGHRTESFAFEKIPEVKSASTPRQKKKVVDVAEPAIPEAKGFVELANLDRLQLQPDQKPTQLRLPDGTIKSIKTWKDILLESCRFVLKNNSDIRLPYPDKAGKKTALFSTVRPPKGISSTEVEYQGKQVFIHTNYSASSCLANALHVLKLSPTNLQLASTAVAF